ncbi:YigZ family protein [Abyssalbus ytuae]|uniref:YigZ family protein n=1 Tax=Abyssalbus ytuae TaxID=2926907 RepID=A0A9E7D219_9FLAO|nr:YigZ family protein [Abyssalbus ytuae]UOB17693.1 YigZ family protein [Abyssalbus ytuae]
MKEIDIYKTILHPSPEVIYKDKNSKFLGYAFPVTNEEQIKEYIESLKKRHHSARHWCYAWQLGTENKLYRANDDGEPNNSAGQPIFGQIQSHELTNILIVVVRYFGGVKLGVGGLITAYKTAAQLAVEASKIVEKTIEKELIIAFDYDNMNKVMRIIKENNLNIIKQNFEIKCEIILSVRKKDATTIFNLFNSAYKITVKWL